MTKENKYTIEGTLSIAGTERCVKIHLSKIENKLGRKKHGFCNNNSSKSICNFVLYALFSTYVMPNSYNRKGTKRNTKAY